MVLKAQLGQHYSSSNDWLDTVVTDGNITTCLWRPFSKLRRAHCLDHGKVEEWDLNRSQQLGSRSIPRTALQVDPLADGSSQGDPSFTSNRNHRMP